MNKRSTKSRYIMQDLSNYNIKGEKLSFPYKESSMSRLYCPCDAHWPPVATEQLKYNWSDLRCAVKYTPDFEDLVPKKENGK